jgi:D-tyrosyl-tRNA(Tyr) deacylase
MDEPKYVLVFSDEDPVARAVADRLPPAGPALLRSEGCTVRRAAPGVGRIQRAGRHVFDDGLDAALPPALRAAQTPLVFPSIHRSAHGVRCLTVHPLGNPGPEAALGGDLGVLVPTAPRLMTGALRRLSESAGAIGLSATFETTHHGPRLSVPAFFAEIGYGEDPAPPRDAVGALSSALLELEEDPNDRIAVGVGGGHYAPHFTELALKRRWSFGHMISRHALAGATPGALRAAVESTPGAEGILYQRAADVELAQEISGVGRLRDGDAPPRGR